MKNNHKDIDLIERYLNKNLTQDEREVFNRKLEADLEFNRLFFEMERFIKGIHLSAQNTTKEEKLSNLEKALPIKKKQENKEEIPVIPMWGWLIQYKTVIAAVITPLILVSIVIFNLKTSNDPLPLFNQYFTYYDNQGSGILRGDKDEELLQTALLLYDRGKYLESLQIFDQIKINEKNNKTIWMYAGNANLGQGNTSKAIPMFESIIQHNTGFVLQAKWYLSLCYLKDGNLEKAESLLEEIKTIGKYKSEEAGKILDQIRN